MDQQLFGRAARITIGTTQITLAAGDGQNALAAWFKITKNLKGEPNKCEIKITNLSAQTRAKFETGKVYAVIVEAGYGSDLHTLYSGQLRAMATERTGADVVSSFSSGDGETAVAQGRALTQVPQKITPSALLALATQGLQASGVGAGNLQQAQGLAGATFGGPARTLHGNAARVMTDVCTMNGMNWSIQDGNLQILKIGAFAKPEAQAVKLSASSGLIESPSVDSKGVMKCKALIQPGLMPGFPVVLDAEFLKGTYRIEEVEFTGATWDKEWYCEITGRKWT